MARLAQDHGLNANMLTRWKRQYLAGLHAECDQAILLPVSVPDELTIAGGPSVVAQRATPGESAVESTGKIEIEICGALVRLNGSVDASQLRLVLRCLKTS